MDNSKLKTAIVGCGAISRKHADALARNADRFDVVGLFDVDAERASALANTLRSDLYFSSCRPFTTMESMADETRPDVVAIATPSFLHAEQAVFWMERGAHLVLEKPVALSTADMERIAKSQRATARKIAVGYVLRHTPQIRLLARALAERRFGRIFHVNLSIYWNRNDEYYRSAPWRGTWANDGGTLMNQATHGIDLVQWILGAPPDEVSGRVARYLRPVEADDFAAATLRYRDGAIATIQATVDTYGSNLGTRLTVLGEHGLVELSGNGPDAITAWRFPEDRDWSSIDKTLLESGVLPDAGKVGHAGLYEDLADAIASDREPLTSYDGSRISAEIVLAILKSHKDHGPVSFPLDFATQEMANVGL